MGDLIKDKMYELMGRMDPSKGLIGIEWENMSRTSIILTYHIFYSSNLRIKISEKGIANIVK